MNETYSTVKEIADKFRVSRQAVYDWIESGQLKAIRVGKRVRIPESSVAGFIKPIGPGEIVETSETD
jgi:excisionase family DNA binding protein